MALRHPVPDFDPSIMVQGELQPLPRFPEPSVVEFRPKASREDVVRDMLQAKCMRVTAAVGAGKSTDLPRLLAEYTEGVVVHSVPARGAAKRTFNYVRTLTERPVFFSDNISEQMPEKGVVLMSSWNLALRTIAWASGSVAPPERMVFFLDECHESDAASVFLRETARTWSFVQRVFLSSATFGPVESRKREPLGKPSYHFYDEEDVSKWDLDTPSAPWNPYTLSGHLLITSDSVTEVRTLKRKYAEADFPVYHLTSQTPLEEQDRAFAAFRDERHGLCVIIVDYSYRSADTFPNVARAIDTCKVGIPMVKDGEPFRMYRRAYRFENEQFFGRGARVPGSVCEMWKPRGELELKMCHLELLEIDALVLLFRMAGYRPPPKYAKHSTFAEGKVPRDIVKAMQSALPLRMLAHDQLVDYADVRPIVRDKPARRQGSYIDLRRPVTPTGRDMKDVFAEHRKSRRGSVVSGFGGLSLSGSSSSVTDDERPYEPQSSRSSQSYEGAAQEVDPYEQEFAATYQAALKEPVDVAEVWKQVVRDADHGLKSARAGLLTSDEFLYYPRVERYHTMQTVFPSGFASVERLLEGSPRAVAETWSVDRIMVATRLTIDAYNNAQEHVKAIAVIMGMLRDKLNLKEYADPAGFIAWMSGIMDENSKHKAVVERTRSVLANLHDPVGYMRVEPNMSRIHHIAKGHLDKLRTAVVTGDEYSAADYAQQRLEADMPAVRNRGFIDDPGAGSLTDRMLESGTVRGQGAKTRSLVWVRAGVRNPKTQRAAGIVNRFAI